MKECGMIEYMMIVDRIGGGIIAGTLMLLFFLSWLDKRDRKD